MRWLWIDRIIENDPGRRLVAVKNVSLAEDVLHDHFPAEGDRPAQPVMPMSLLIEGMAQTAGLLVGQMSGFSEKVILAKVNRALLTEDVFPGDTVRFEATIERHDPSGVSTTGTISVLDHASGRTMQVGEVELIFSHIDRNRAGTAFPEENFVFTENFRLLVADLELNPPAGGDSQGART